MSATPFAMDSIKVEVRFYDDAEKAKLLTYPTAGVMQALVAKPLEIPKAEFLTYYLFHRIKLGTEGYRDYDSVAQKVHLWLGAIGECVDYENGSVRTPDGAKAQLTEVSERVGEAIGLSVISRVHGLTESDWAPIPEERGRGARPSFDFEIASDGGQFVQVETKGSSVVDNRVLSDAVKEQKRRIDKKKVKLDGLAKKGEDPNPAGLRYGTIAVIDARKEGYVRCLLTDPPPDEVDEDPARFRLLNRMRRLRDWICFLSPRSALTAALATRVGDLEAMNDPFELDGVPLLRGTGESFDIMPYSILNLRHSNFMASKSRVMDGPAGGVVIQLSERELFFFGIRENLLVMAANQEFGDITDYKAEVDSIIKTVDCTFSAGRYPSLELPPSVANSARKKGGYVHFSLSGKLNYSPEGLVFGILPLPEM
jgi:hypothetical protein